MSTSTRLNTKIDADDVSLANILDHQKFTIDYFQREYLWERKHVEQMLDDLSTAFHSNYSSKHEREQVEDYNFYYMGPIVMSSKDGKLSIIDGQQRLTSLTLLLIYLNNRQSNLEDQEPVDTLIYSERFGKKSYNMQIADREKCLNALFTKGTYEPTSDDDESVYNLVRRYNDIEELFPENIDDHVFPFFISWLKEKIIFVKIVTYSEENAYTIFETMNDRGLNLTPSEMLKGYLLAKLTNPKLKNDLNALWKKRISELHKWSQQEDLEFFKAWLRAKYADTIRPGKQGSAKEDFEKISTSFHTWVKDKLKIMGLEKETHYVEFIKNKFDFYSSLYLRIYESQTEQKNGLKSLYFIDWYGIAGSLAHPLLLSPIVEKDDVEVQNCKLEMVAHFIECFAVYRSINQRTLSQSSLRYTIFSLVKEIRNKNVTELSKILSKKVREFEETLEGIWTFNLNQQNKRFVRFLLARITNYIENECGINTHIDDYMDDDLKRPAQIEHIWADVHSYHKDEFNQILDFQKYRNGLGGLILLPKGTNQSFNKEKYEKKLPHYLKQNLLAQSLHKDCYKKNPNFTKWYTAMKLIFKPHGHFKKKDLEERTALYEQIANIIWSPDKFEEIERNYVNKKRILKVLSK